MRRTGHDSGEHSGIASRTLQPKDHDVPDIETSFDIDQPPSRVWTLFQDVPEVVTCMPGTVLTGQTGESTFQGRVTVKLGPITAAFEGEATIVEMDHGARVARIEASGIDRQGNNRAKASIVYEIHQRDGGSQVKLHGSIRLTGALAQMGRDGIIQDVANHLTAQFAEHLRSKLALSGQQADSAADVQEPPRAIEGTQLTRMVIAGWIKRMFGLLIGRGG